MNASARHGARWRPRASTKLISGTPGSRGRPCAGVRRFRGNRMKIDRSNRLTAAAIPVEGVLEKPAESERRAPAHMRLVAVIVLSTAAIAAIDVWTSSELVGSILF